MPREVEDIIRIRVATSMDAYEDRWWGIVQPPPSVAFALRGRIGAALGPAADHAMRLMLARLDPQGEADLEADEEAVGEAAALRAFRRARSGQRIVDAGTDAGAAADVLLFLAGWAARAAGARLDSALLLGEHERTGDSLGFRWGRPSLLHRLLLDSRLRFGGVHERPRWAGGGPGEDHPGADLWNAVNKGSVGHFVSALDGVVAGPDELTMLTTWALLHLWRPF